MSLPTYQEYKSSGVEALGPIPVHWQLVSMKRVAAFNYGDALPVELRHSEGEIFVYGSNGPVGEHSTANTSAPTILVGRKGSSGAINWSNDAVFAIDTVYYIDKRVCSADLRYVYWLLHTANLQAFSQDTGVPGLSREYAYAIRVCLPPPMEQSTIAAFLDRETSRIDALVAEQEKLIALLKEKRQAVISHAVTKGLNPAVPMKDSGVEWLGEVPAHWEILRVGALFNEASNVGVDGLPILSVSIHDGVSDKQLSEDEMDRKVTRSDDVTKYKKVHPGDLVYNMMRAWQGGFGTVSVEGMVSPAYVVARPAKSFSTQFVELLLRSPKAVEEMRRHSHGVTDFRLRLYWGEFKTMKLAMPPVTEQSQILKAIDQECGSIDALVTEAEKAIDLLKEHRSALISAAATGKIDVRQVQSVEAA